MPLDMLPTISADSRRQLVVKAIRDAIVTGRLLPGERLVEREISARMNASRGPVREALQQLEHEGLVISYPYRGTQVAEISAAEVEQVLVPVRLIIERYAVDRALPRLTEQDFTALDGIVTTMAAAERAGDHTTLVDTDVAFHELLLECSGQAQCLQLWRTILPRVRAYFHRDASRHPAPGEVTDGHRILLDLLRTRDMRRVGPTLEVHILETLDLEGDL